MTIIPKLGGKVKQKRPYSPRQISQKAIALHRVSTAKQAKEGKSLAAHKWIFASWCNEVGYENGGVVSFQESGFTDKPYKLLDALDHVKARDAIAVFVFENRIGNTPERVARIKSLCDEMGIPWEVIHPGLTPPKGEEWTDDAREVKGLQTEGGIDERKRRGLRHGRGKHPLHDEVIKWLDQPNKTIYALLKGKVPLETIRTIRRRHLRR